MLMLMPDQERTKLNLSLALLAFLSVGAYGRVQGCAHVHGA